MVKKVLVALPPGLLEQVDLVAQTEHRTRSDLIREALRRYLEAFKRTQQTNFTVSTVAQPAPQQVPAAMLTEASFSTYRGGGGPKLRGPGITHSGVPSSPNRNEYTRSADWDDVRAAAAEAGVQVERDFSSSEY